MADIVLSIASKVAEYLAAPIGRRCGYLIFSNSYVGQLKEELEKLDDARVGLQRSVVDAENNMREIKREVNRWKNDAETVANKACGMLDNEGRAKKTCFCGWLPNPKERYCLGRDARKTAQAIQALIPQGKFESVYYESAPPGRVTGTPDVNSSAGDGGDTIADSRASVFQGIMKALDDEKLRVIGVYGPGGVGKTTLLEEVEKKLRKVKGPFHMIVKAKVSQIPVSKNIQDEIADALKLDLKDVQSESGRANRLLERLQRDPSEKVLVILDDLWGELDLKAVGIPSKDMSGKCKLLLASRFKDVLEQKMLADRTFFLGGLNNDEAFRLFEKTVGDRLQGEEELKVIAAQVVKKLAGLPLLIISVASTLKNRGVSAWKNALTKIDVKKMETIVKLSYDHLESEDERSLFLLCGLIGGTIPIEILLGLGMGLGFFEGYNKTIQSSRDRLNAMLESLHSICLLQDWGNDEDNVTIHDLYSEVVVSIPFRGQNSLMMNSNYGSWSKEKLENCWAIYQVNAVSDGFTKLMACQFPYLKMLMLSESRDRWMWGPNLRDGGDRCRRDFIYMKELQVLYFQFLDITTLPSSIGILENLRSLYLNYCLLEDVAIIGKLKALQILSFEGSIIPRFPKEIGELTNLRSLSLENCYSYMPCTFEPNALKGLINLEELYMRENSYQWMDKDEIVLESCNAMLTELKSLTKLTSLEISIEGPTILSMDSDLPFENLNRFWIHIGIASMSRERKGLRTMTTMTLNLEGCDSILSKEWVQKTLHKTQYLCLEGLREFKKNACNELGIGGFPQLKHLDIQNSPSVKYIASSSNSAFIILESLFLNNLINLEKICHGHIASECFSKLKLVKVENCNRLKYLWCLSQMQNLVHLDEVKVWICDSVLAIARKDMVPADYRVELRYLRCLDLGESPNMTSFCTGAEIASEGAPIQAGFVDGGGGGDEGIQLETTTSDLLNTYSDSFFDGKISLPNLKDLKLNLVGSFKRIWHDELSRSSFCKLATIAVENCSNLLQIFPSTIIGRLHNLQSVEVKNCPSLKSLFDFGSLDSNTEQTMLLAPELVSINIETCPSLESLFNCGSLDSNDKIVLLPKLEEVSVSGANRLRYVVMSHSQIVLGFPCLETVSFKNCSDLRYLFSKCTATTLVKLLALEITNCKQMKEVILEKEAGRSEVEVMSFPCLSTLTLEELDNLISFGSGSCSYYFSSLEDLRIVGCCNFRAFISSPTGVKRQLGKTIEENDESRQPLFNEMVTFPNIRNLEIEGIPCKELWINHVPIDSIVSSHQFLSENIEVKNCPSLKSLFDFGSLDSNTEQNAVLLPELVRINVESCPSLESLFNCGSLDSNAEHKIILLPKLETIRVSGAKKLRHVVMSHSQIVLGFPSLETVSVENCSDLRYLFPKYIATTLMKLEWLTIRKCEQMKEVILEKEAGRSKAEVMSFPCLSTLTLEELDNLISFGSGSCSYYFSSLEDLRIVGCCNFGAFILSPTGVKRQLGKTAEENDESPQSLFNEMVTFPNIRNLEIEGVPCKELWNNHVPADSIVSSHQFLSKNVKVKNCPSLKSLFDFGSLDSNTEQNVVLLPELVRIGVESCASLESLFNFGSLDSNVEHKIILLPKLEEVRVSGAKKLRQMVMSHSQIVLGFPSLETVSVEYCSDLRYLFSKCMATTLVKLLALEITNCKQMKEVILEKEASRSEAEVMSFPCLSTLTLKELDNLISFGSGSCSYYFSPLEDLRLVGCYNFRAFIPSPTGVERQLGKTMEENDESRQPLFNEMVTFPNIRNLEIEGVPCKELWINHVPVDSIVSSHQFLSENIKVKNYPSLKSLFDFGSLDSNTEQNAVLLPELVRINVESCPSLESLFNCGSLDSNAEHKIILLPKLETVRVSGAKKLRHVVMSHSQIVLGFPSLETVSVEYCSDLRYLFSKCTATTLMKLEWLTIRKCEQMKEVILEKEVGRSEAEVMSFPCLSTLTLEKLDNLISFGSGSCSYYFSSLEDLRIVGCCNFGAFIPSPIGVKRQLGKMVEENDESPQSLFNEMVTFSNITSLEIEGLRCKKLWSNHVPANSIVCSHRFLWKNVKVKKCPSLKSLFDFGSLDSNMEQNTVILPELVRINIESCPSLESLFNFGSLDSNVEHKIILLPKLEEVRVSGAKKLRHVVMSHSQIVLGFPSLKTVNVNNCSDLRYLFPKYTATTLMKLEMLIISKCKQMKEVILEKEAGHSEAAVMSFPCLSILTLVELDNLISFGSRSCSYYFSSLKYLRIVGCYNFGVFIPSPTSVKRQLGKIAEENDESPQPLFNRMVTFPNITSLEIDGLRCKELWNNQIPIDSFRKLESLRLRKCDNFQRIATSYMWKNLQRCLEELEVISCRLIEIIYEGDGTNIENGKLRRLVLRDLKNLRCIWQSDSLPNISFPNLRDVKAVSCPRLEMLFPTFTAEFLGQIEELVVESCEDMELIVGHEKGEEATGTTITFFELIALRLFKLPKFRSFLPEKYSLKFSCSEDFPSLQVLSIISCGVEPDQVLGDWDGHETLRELCSELELMSIKGWFPRVVDW